MRIKQIKTSKITVSRLDLKRKMWQWISAIKGLISPLLYFILFSDQDSGPVKVLDLGCAIRYIYI